MAGKKTKNNPYEVGTPSYSDWKEAKKDAKKGKKSIVEKKLRETGKYMGSDLRHRHIAAVVDKMDAAGKAKKEKKKAEMLKSYKKQKAKSIKSSAKKIVKSKKSKYDVKDIVKEVSAMKQRTYKDLPGDPSPELDVPMKGVNLTTRAKRKWKRIALKEKQYRKRIGQ